MWFIGVEVEQETSAPPPKKILDPPLIIFTFGLFFIQLRIFYLIFIFCEIDHYEQHGNYEKRILARKTVNVKKNSYLFRRMYFGRFEEVRKSSKQFAL